MWFTHAARLRAAEKAAPDKAEINASMDDYFACVRARREWQKANPEGWPPLLIKALTHSSHYTCAMRNGITVEFGLAATIDGTTDWAALKPAEGCAAIWPAAQLRVADIVWIGEKPVTEEPK